MEVSYCDFTFAISAGDIRPLFIGVAFCQYLYISKANFVPDSRRDECGVPSAAHKRGATQKPGESGFALREGSSLAAFRRTLPKHTTESMPASAFAKNQLKPKPSNVKVLAKRNTTQAFFFSVLQRLLPARRLHR